MELHRVFTDHVRQIMDGAYIDIESVLGKLKPDLLAQLKRRGLKPSSLGYAGERWDDESLEEITYDCYAYSFIGLEGKLGRQRAYLEAKVASGKAIEGLVRQKVKWFVQEIHETKYADGSGVFKNLKSAILEIVAEGGAELSTGDNISAESVVFISSENDEALPLEMIELGEFVLASSLWSEVIKVASRQSEKAKKQCKLAIFEMIKIGKVPFLFGQLVVAVSAQLTDKTTGNEKSELEFSEEGVTRIRTDTFDDRYQLLESKEALCDQVRQAIESLLNKGPKSKKQLLNIFDTFVSLRSQDHGKVKQVDVRTQMGIARSTFSDYMKLLDSILEPILNEYQNS